MTIAQPKQCIDFVIVGAQKAGTSVLHAFLTQHPQISMPVKKEMHYFNRTSSLDFSLPLWRDRKRLLFHNAFPGFPEPSMIYGEATPHYMTWDVALDRIHTYNPNIRVVAVLRNPIARAFSHWNMEWQRGLVQTDFETAIKQELSTLQQTHEALDKVYSFVQRGLYAHQVERLWRKFGRANVHIIKHANLLHHHEKTLRDLHSFLGVSHHGTKAQKVHERSYHTGLREETRQALLRLYHKDIERIESMLGWDCSDWRE
ncbi:MAG: sulfotransferase [Bacteroidetes bacterium]|nr:sulfotransferase [Bacteroidota bacterium]MDA0903704.1 sulfotransferase [Bacteroidota bacterium]MDA1242476.1 sulfotransferase [Bacteroidota bacterium]